MGMFSFIKKGLDTHNAAMNAFLAKYTYGQLTTLQQKQVHDQTLLLMKRDGFIKTFSDEGMPKLSELITYSFYALSMLELNIPPALPYDKWKVVSNPFVALNDPEDAVDTVNKYFIKTYNVYIDLKW